MEKKGFVHSLPFKLLTALVIGIAAGLFLSSAGEGALTLFLTGYAEKHGIGTDSQ